MGDHMTYVQYAEPYPGSRGDRFGSTVGRPHPHRGQDTAPGGLPALALADGSFAGKQISSELGNCVVIAHPDGKFTGYAHLAGFDGVVVGAPVRRGQQFGMIGSTGSAAKGRHLHYTLGDDKWGIFSGRVEDPLAYIKAHSGPQSNIAPASSGGKYGGDLYTAAETDGTPGPIYYALAQKYSNKRFGTHLTVDGVDGPNTEVAIGKIVAADINRQGYPYGRTDVEDGGKRGPIYWKKLQTHSNKYYGTKLKVDGIPGEWTYKAEARTAAFWLNREPGI